MQLSVVTTLYNTASFLPEFHRRISEVASEETDEFEIVLVVDGSPDDSLSQAIALQRRDPRVVVVDLSRNFGHHRAIMTGLAYARGARIFLIDSDLEEPPEALRDFRRRFAEGDCDVVYGIQQARRGGWFERLSGELFYWLVNLLSDVKLPRNLITARLMSRRYVDSLLQHRERELFLSVLWAETGYAQVPLSVTKAAHKRSDYGFTRKLHNAIDTITMSASKLLHYVFYLGLAIFGLSFLYLTFIVTTKLFLGWGVPGWSSLMASVWLFGGLTILILGLIGTYVCRIFQETKMRPFTIVRAVYGDRGDGEAELSDAMTSEASQR